MHKKVEFPNKLRLIEVPTKGTDAVTVLFLFGVGSRYETKEITQLIITLSKNIDIYNQLSINAKRRANDFSPKAFESCIADVLV